MRRPLTILVAVIAVALGSVLALRQMPRDIFPTLGIPTIYVAQPFGGMDPAQMEGYLTYYYEYHFLNVKPDRLRSYNMSPDEIVAAITAANIISPSGNMPIKRKYPMVPLNSVVRNIKDLESVPIRTGTYPDGKFGHDGRHDADGLGLG